MKIYEVEKHYIIVMEMKLMKNKNISIKHYHITFLYMELQQILHLGILRLKSF